MRPLLRGILAATALSLAPVAVVTTTAAPAIAADTVETTTSFDPDINPRGQAGGYLSITGEVVASDGSSPLAGTAYLQSLAPGSKTWKDVGTDDSPGFAYYPDYDKYKTNTKLRIYFTGGTYQPGTSSERVYDPSVSRVLNIKVYRLFDIKSVSGKRQPTADIKVTPKFGKKKLLVQKKAKKGWNTFRKVKTNKKGKVRLSVPGSRNGTKYRLVAPGNKQYMTTKNIITATQYRPIVD